MGDIADYYRDQELEQNLYYNLSSNKDKRYNKWLQADGSEINVSSMTKSHLINSINKIKRDKWRRNWLHILEKELESRK